MAARGAQAVEPACWNRLGWGVTCNCSLACSFDRSSSHAVARLHEPPRATRQGTSQSQCAIDPRPAGDFPRGLVRHGAGAVPPKHACRDRFRFQSRQTTSRRCPPRLPSHRQSQRLPGLTESNSSVRKSGSAANEIWDQPSIWLGRRRLAWAMEEPRLGSRL